jgi:hypothetical protein
MLALTIEKLRPVSWTGTLPRPRTHTTEQFTGESNGSCRGAGRLCGGACIGGLLSPSDFPVMWAGVVRCRTLQRRRRRRRPGGARTDRAPGFVVRMGGPWARHSKEGWVRLWAGAGWGGGHGINTGVL